MSQLLSSLQSMNLTSAQWISLFSTLSMFSMAIFNLTKCVKYWSAGRLVQHRSLMDKLSPPGFYVSLVGHLIVFLLPLVYFVVSQLHRVGFSTVYPFNVTNWFVDSLDISFVVDSKHFVLDNFGYYIDFNAM